nr:low molecular weight protein-tyrosine-phosphatase [Streptococcus zalophi]
MKIMKICFVCYGNICRSPMAEFIMKDLVKDDDRFYIESRATSRWEKGKPIHTGTQKMLEQHDIDFNYMKGSQPIRVEDLQEFDYIIGMDESNVSDLKKLAKGKLKKKIFMFAKKGIPDPWYTGDFEETYRLISQGCLEWLDYFNNL